DLGAMNQVRARPGLPRSLSVRVGARARCGACCCGASRSALTAAGEPAQRAGLHGLAATRGDAGCGFPRRFANLVVLRLAAECEALRPASPPWPAAPTR